MVAGATIAPDIVGAGGEYTYSFGFDLPEYRGLVPDTERQQPMPRIGPWQGQLERFLSTNANKPSRERLTLIRIFEELRGLGYEGGYDAVRRLAKSWSQNRGA